MTNVVFFNYQYYISKELQDYLINMNHEKYKFLFCQFSISSIYLREKNILLDDNIYICYAENPESQAFEMFEKTRIVIKNSKVILCSESTTKKDYRASLLSGFSDLLQAPFSSSELFDCLNFLDDNSLHKKNIEESDSHKKINEYINEEKTMIEEFIRKIITDVHTNTLKIKNNQYNIISNKYKQFIICTAEIQLNVEDYIEQNYEQKILSCLDILYQHFEDEYNSESYKFEILNFILNGKLCTVFYTTFSDSNLLEDEIKLFLLKVEQNFFYHTNYNCNLGISNIFSDITLVSDEYKNSNTALFNTFYKHIKDEHYFRYSNKYSYFNLEDQDLELTISKTLRNNGLKSFYSIFEELIYVFEQKKVFPGYTKRYFLSLFNKLIYNNEDISYISKSKLFINNNIDRVVDLINNIYDIAKYFSRLIDKLLYNKYSKKSFVNENIMKAEEFILNNYEKKLTLQDVADHIFVNQNYLSGLFKKHTGVNFFSYLTQIRMLKAKLLLSNTDKKIYEIGNEVGYPETISFTRAFMKFEGVSPKQYRLNSNNSISLSE